MRIYFLVFFSLLMWGLSAQELSVTVTVTAPAATRTDPTIFNNLEVAIKEFLNNTKWTNDNFDDHERIDANVQLTILEEVGLNTFSGEMIIQSNRPVYNSDYKTKMLNIIDPHISFTYNNFQPLEKSDNRYVDNLSSVLTFYAYMIIGFDYESFSSNGGEPYFRTAQNVINNLPPNLLNSDAGWGNNLGRRNRFTLIENLFNPRLRKFRQSIYEYHINGIDKIADDSERARAVMLSVLNTVTAANISYPNTFLLNTFVDSKGDEIVEIFKVADRNQRRQVYTTLVAVDPSNAKKYGVLK